jgi:hypothetical protein
MKSGDSSRCLVTIIFKPTTNTPHNTGDDEYWYQSKHSTIQESKALWSELLSIIPRLRSQVLAMEWGNFAEIALEMKVANQGTERLGVETGVSGWDYEWYLMVKVSFAME